jgi:hypothetical protein
MKKNGYLILLLLLPLLTDGQLTGSVTSDENKPLSAAITLHPKDKSEILAFAIADKEGTFSINYNITNKDSLELRASLLGYGKQSIYFIGGQQSKFSFTLSPTSIDLPEVKVKTPPVWQRKDTINYNTSAFKLPQDRVIGDIIARLPGMEVTPNGQIKYQGKAINKYYIEGLDLLEDKYGIANNNLPADAVEKVQVLENHQPIRVLDSVSYSDRAALNIKLKNNAKAKLIGRTKLGIGLSPLLSEDELSLMLFKKKMQFINTYKYNNTGVDFTRELTAQNFSDYINAIQNGSLKNDVVSLIKPQKPAIAARRYLFNNAHVATVNQLIPLNKLYQLRINLAYINDFQKQESSNSTTIYFPTDTIHIKENNSYRNNLNRLDADITVIANSAKYFLKNHSRFQLWKPEGNSQIAGVNNIHQQLINPFYQLSNDFRLIKTKQRSIVEIASYAGSVLLPQQLQIQPGQYSSLINNNQPFDALIQNARLKNIYTDNYFSIRKKKGRWNQQYKTGFNLQHQNLQTNLQVQNAGISKNIADTFQNNLEWLRFRVYTESNFSYESTKIRWSTSLPLSYLFIKYSDTTFSLQQQKKALLPTPSTSFQWQINPYWNLSTSLSYSKFVGDINSISHGYILTTYRNFSNNIATLPENSSANGSIAITFRNPVKILFVNMGISISQSKSNLLYSQSYSGLLETLLATVKDNKTNSTNFFSRFSKYIIDWKTSIALNAGYEISKRQQLQAGVLSNFVNHNSNISSTINTKFSDKLNGEYNVWYLFYSTKNANSKANSRFNTFTHSASFNYIPTKLLIIRMAAEYYQNNFSSGKQNYFFADGSIRLIHNKSRIDYEVLLQNILNTKSSTTAMVSDNVAAISNYTIRPRQIIFKLSFALQ